MKVKSVLTQAGVSWDTALVSIGWLSYCLGILYPNPVVGPGFLAIARVLPKALYWQGPPPTNECMSVNPPMEVHSYIRTPVGNLLAGA